MDGGLRPDIVEGFRGQGRTLYEFRDQYVPPPIYTFGMLTHHTARSLDVGPRECTKPRPEQECFPSHVSTRHCLFTWSSPSVVRPLYIHLVHHEVWLVLPGFRHHRLPPPMLSLSVNPKLHCGVLEAGLVDRDSISDGATLCKVPFQL